MKCSLRFQRGIQRVAGGVECGGKRVADDLENIAVMCFNHLMQDLIMARQKNRHGVWILLRQFRAAFDVGEEEGDGARGKVSHDVPPMHTLWPAPSAWIDPPPTIH